MGDEPSEDEQYVEEALRCAATGQATHWPTAAGYLADEMRRQAVELATVRAENKRLRRAADRALSGQRDDLDALAATLDGREA
jgi:hypothetical protein